MAFGDLVVVDDGGGAALERLERRRASPTSAASRGRGRRRAATRPAPGSPGSRGGLQRWGGHAPGQRRVEVVVAADEARRGRAHVASPRRRRAWAAWAATARHTPSTSWSAAATAPAVGTSPISPTPLMPYGASGCGHSTQHALDRRHVLGPQDAERAQRHVGGEAGLGVGREVLGERVAEAHVHRALDLALAQHRVDGPADVVDGDDLVDGLGLAVDHHELGGVAERRVDDRVLDLAELVRPVDAVLALVVDVDPAAVGHRRRAGRRHRAGTHQRAAAAGGLAERRARGWCRR